jgi:hypothetical protein
MPYAPANKLQQEQQVQQGGGVNISGGQGANFDVVPGQEKKQSSSGQYANLQTYLNANQPQSEAMGQKITQNVSQQGQEAQSKIGDFSQQKQSVAAYDPSAAIANAPTLSQAEKQQYQNVKQTGGYSGPQQLEQAQGYDAARTAAQSASDAAKMAGTESGQQELLKKTYARPDYSAGQNKLDQVLLMGNEQAKGQMSDLSSRYSDLYNQFNTTAQDVGSSINQAKQQALANQQAVIGAEAPAWDNLLNPIAQRAQQINEQNPQIYNNVLSDISDTALNQETLNRLGISEGQRLFDLNLGSYLTPNQTQVGLNDAANAEERAKYKALADLFQDQSRTQIGDAGSAIDPLTFNKAQFDQDAFNRLGAFNSLAHSQNFTAGNRQNINGGGWVDVGGNINVADFLQRNPNFQPGQSPLDWSFGDLNTTFSAGPSANEGGGDFIEKIGLPGSGPDLQQNTPEQMQAAANVKNELYDQLLNFLNQQNYNRVVSKES